MAKNKIPFQHRNIKLCLGKRTRLYRFFEILPALLSYGMLILLIVLSIINPLWAAVYLLLLIITMFIKSIIIAYHTIRGHSRLVGAGRVDWHDSCCSLNLQSKATRISNIANHRALATLTTKRIAADCCCPRRWVNSSKPFRALTCGYSCCV